MRRSLALLLVLAAVAAGCGGSEGDGDQASDEPATGPAAVDACLADRGFGLRPAATGVSAVSPSGVELTIALFDSPAAARAAAERAGRTAVGNAVVTSDEPLPRSELTTVQECVGDADAG